MTLSLSRQKTYQLTEEINHHNFLYYSEAQPVISDYEFDQLLEELISLEKSYPQFAQPDSPTQRVGGQITKEFETVEHTYPMMSLSNTYSESELRDFDERVQKALGENYQYIMR
ncbi:MAG: hypothetical protein R2847_05120 [Bacteroidia bacterium]